MKRHKKSITISHGAFLQSQLGSFRFSMGIFPLDGDFFIIINLDSVITVQILNTMKHQKQPSLFTAQFRVYLKTTKLDKFFATGK